ncbi:MAG: DUF4340 domain-containing protein [Gemmataceae bacterium]|nr:DUF4340 domain-containing protein [Gemmataceae bacterium]
MNFRTTGILFGLVLAFALVLLGMSLFEGDDKSSDVLLAKLVLAGKKPADVDTVEITRAGEPKIKLTREGDGWRVDEPIKVKADKGQVDRLVDELFKVRPIQFTELSSNKATHGLEPAGVTVTVSAGGLSETVNVGDVLGGRSAVAFVTTASRPDRPMAVPREGVDPLLKDRASGSSKDLAKGVNDYRSKQVFTVPSQMVGEDVTALTMVGRGDDLALTRTPDGWRMTAHYRSRTNVGGKEETRPLVLENVDADPKGDLTAGPTTFNGVQPLLAALANLQAIGADDFLPDDPAKLAEYGLADASPDRIKVEMKVKAGPGQPERTETAFIGSEVKDQPNRVYVKVPGTPGVIRASTSNAKGIAGVLADPSPVRNRNLLPSDVKSTFVAIDITRGSNTARLRQPAGGFGQWKLYGEPGDPTDANAAAVGKIVELINTPRAVKDFPPPNDANFAPNELKAELKLWSETETPADPKQMSDPNYEPRPKGNPVVIQIGKVVADPTGRTTEIYVRRTLPSGAKADFILPGEVKVGGSSSPSPLGPQSFPGATGTDANVLGTLAKTRLDLLDPSLKSFSPSPGVVTKLTLSPANQPTLEVSYDDKPDPPYYPTGKWTYSRFPAGQPQAKSPPLSADPNELFGLLQTLATLSAAGFDIERPSEAQRVERGVGAANPRLKVTVTLKAQTPPPALPGQPAPPPAAAEERVYYLGNDVARDGKTYVYAMQEGRNVVFLLDKAMFDRLAAADVRDRTVVRFDVAKVRRVTVFGWAERNPAGPVNVLAFDKNPQGNWVYAPFPPGQAITGIPVQSPPLTLDPGKVNTFLAALNGLRADSFLPPGQRPEYGFAPNQKGFGVVIEVEGSPQPIRLNVGAGVRMDADGKTIKEFVPVEQADRYVVWMDTPADPSVNPFTVSAPALKPFKENFPAFAVR